jgi:hypothetical protein
MNKFFVTVALVFTFATLALASIALAGPGGSGGG